MICICACTFLENAHDQMLPYPLTSINYYLVELALCFFRRENFAAKLQGSITIRCRNQGPSVRKI